MIIVFSPISNFKAPICLRGRIGTRSGGNMSSIDQREEKRKKLSQRVTETLGALEERQQERQGRKKEVAAERARFEEERHHLKVV